MIVVTEQDRSKVKQYLKEAVKATERMTEEQAHISDILKTLKADHNLPPVIARKVIAAMRKGNAPEVREENDMFSDLIEIVG